MPTDEFIERKSSYFGESTFDLTSVTGLVVHPTGTGEVTVVPFSSAFNVSAGTFELSAVSTAYLADGAVDTDKIADGAVTSAKLATGSVTQDQIATDAVRTDEIRDTSVTTAKIANLAVTTAKLADGSVTSAKLDASLGATRRTLAIGTLTSSIANVEVDLEWNTPEISDSDISISLDEITFTSGGTFDIDVQAMCQGSDRCEVRIRTYKDTGSGFVELTDHTARNYTSRDTDQNTGNASLSTMLALNDGDKLKFSADCNADGTAALLTAGTILRISGS